MERFAGVFVDEAVVAHDPARFFQEFCGAHQILAVPAATAVGGRLVGFGEHARRHKITNRFQQRQLALARQAAGGQFGAVEVARRQAEEIVALAVQPHEIRDQPQRFAHPHVLKARLVEVPEHRPPQPPRLLHRQPLALEHASLESGRHRVVALPVLRHVLHVEVDHVALHGFRLHAVVGKVVELHDVEVEAASHHRQVRAPVVGDALPANPAPDLEILDPVRAGAKRRLHRRLGDVAGLPVVLGNDRHLADADGQQRVVAGTFSDAKENLAPVQHFDGLDGLQRRAHRRRGLVSVHAVGVGHVVDGERLAVVPTRAVADLEGDPGAVLRHRHALGQAPIPRRRFVRRLGEQRIVQEVPMRRGHAQPRHHLRGAQRGRIEGIPAARAVAAHRAALGRLRIHIVEVGEVRRILRLGEEGVAVLVVDARCFAGVGTRWSFGVAGGDRKGRRQTKHRRAQRRRWSAHGLGR